MWTKMYFRKLITKLYISVQLPLCSKDINACKNSRIFVLLHHSDRLLLQIIWKIEITATKNRKLSLFWLMNIKKSREENLFALYIHKPIHSSRFAESQQNKKSCSEDDHWSTDFCFLCALFDIHQEQFFHSRYAINEFSEMEKTRSDILSYWT